MVHRGLMVLLVPVVGVVVVVAGCVVVVVVSHAGELRYWSISCGGGCCFGGCWDPSL
jgi:hypothetical protein